MIPGLVKFFALRVPLGITPAWPPAFAPWEYVPPPLGLPGALGPPASVGVGARTTCGCSRPEPVMGSVLIVAPAGPYFAATRGTGANSSGKNRITVVSGLEAAWPSPQMEASRM